MSKTPLATLALLAANFIAAYFSLNNPDAIQAWGFTPSPLAPLGGFERILTAFTSIFLHIDPVHLLANMLFLAAVGPPVEKATGPIKFVAIYVLSGFAGVLGHWLAARIVGGSLAAEPVVGASGAIAGLVGYAWLRFYRAKVPAFPKVYIPVWSLILVWMLLQIAGAYLVSRQYGGAIAFWAHIGGFAAGFAFALLFGAGRGANEEAWAAALSAAEARSPGANAAAANTRLKADPSDSRALAALIESLEDTGQQGEAVAAAIRLTESDPGFEDGFAIRKLAAERKLGEVPAAKRLRLASEVGPVPAEMLLESILEEPPGPETPAALAGLIGILAASDRAAAKRYAGRLAAEYDLAPETVSARSHWPDLF